jgi:hypothetical protein
VIKCVGDTLEWHMNFMALNHFECPGHHRHNPWIGSVWLKHVCLAHASWICGRKEPCCLEAPMWLDRLACTTDGRVLQPCSMLLGARILWPWLNLWGRVFIAASTGKQYSAADIHLRGTSCRGMRGNNLFWLGLRGSQERCDNSDVG